jgi:hypothetical protein
MRIIKLLNKLKRRLRWLFIKLKHRIWFWRRIQPCWCKTAHESNYFAKFRQTIIGVLKTLGDQQRLPAWFADKASLRLICTEILQGNFWIFNNQFYQFKGAMPDWFASCQKNACSGCKLDFNNQAFCWNLWQEWEKKLRSNYCLNPDLRVVWEKSRLQFLLPLVVMALDGLEPAAHSFVTVILEDWINNNEFLYGPNWTCAMEVGIRATNLVWLASLMPMEQALEERIVRLLCLHAQFIEDCWEDFEKPNNHLLADILGMIYLTAFFARPELLKQYLIQADREFFQQTNSDGTSYEGSTTYHHLVSEFLLHRILLADALGFTVDDAVRIRNTQMLKFFDETCAVVDGGLKIGDCDSSKFLFGVAAKPLQPFAESSWQDFGLWLFKEAGLGVALRLPLCNAVGPTGHLHQDFLALSINFDDTPLFVDAGSGFYTRHPRLRKFLRSFASHTTLSAKDWLATSFTEDLFALKLDAQNITLESGLRKIMAGYRSQSLFVARELEITANGAVKPQIIKVTDLVHSFALQEWVWSFVLAPGVVAKDLTQGRWELAYKQKKFLLQSELPLELKTGLLATEYGTIQTVLALRAKIVVDKSGEYIHTISRFYA